ncbi:MAG: hypothetical protein OXR66_03420 [Candidatus Woesearchaeota archaeon]|nr:hypothetical protein [Candidatus Woesearchaeota archaeon]
MQGKGLKFTKEQLEELYIQKRLSLNQIGEKFGCNGTNILYWLKKYNIPRRGAYLKKIDIPKEVLYDLYWRKNWSSSRIAKKFGIKHGRTIVQKLTKAGIPRKTVSEATTRKYKNKFSENLMEKAYLLGLRTGDFHARWMKLCVRFQSTTTHLALLELLDKSLSKYGKTCTYLSKNPAREDEWFIYTDLNASFSFLIEKPERIPEWILMNNNYFFAFLTAYSDCEGAFTVVKSHKNCVRFVFSIASGDKGVLEQTKEKLESLGYHPRIYLDALKGTRPAENMGPFRKDMYDLTLYPKKEVIQLIEEFLKYSKHSEKIRKMQYILKNKNDNSWKSISPGWKKIKREIQRELLKNQTKEKKKNPLRVD